MKKWFTLLFLCLAFFFYMSDRQLFGLLVPLIQSETGLTKIQIGIIDSVFYGTVAVMMPFSGFAGDRWPRTRIIAVAILGWGVVRGLFQSNFYRYRVERAHLGNSPHCTSVRVCVNSEGSQRWLRYHFASCFARLSRLTCYAVPGS